MSHTYTLVIPLSCITKLFLIIIVLLKRKINKSFIHSFICSNKKTLGDTTRLIVKMGIPVQKKEKEESKMVIRL